MASNVVGRMGYPINLETSSKFDKATVKFQYDDTLLNGTKEDDLGVLWHDVANDKFVYMPCTVDNNTRTVTFETTHFSNYILIDNKKWFDEWRNSINYKKSPDDPSLKHFDIVLTIDNSGSMYWNDNSHLRQAAAKQFVDRLEPNDKAAVVDFWDDDMLTSHLTNDKEKLKAAIDEDYQGCGTNIGKAVNTAMDELTSSDALKDNNDKIIILLTDGDGDWDSDVLSRANKNKIKIITIGLNDYYVGGLKQIADSTGGKYYQATKASDLLSTFQSISDDEAQQVDPKDTDGDGLPDVLETRGMRLSNGQVVTTYPDDGDSDGDGLLDGEEIQNLMVNSRPEGVPSDIDVPNYSYFKMRSNPKEKDTDGDGILDNVDKEPLIFNNPTYENFEIGDNDTVRNKDAIDAMKESDDTYGSMSTNDILMLDHIRSIKEVAINNVAGGYIVAPQAADNLSHFLKNTGDVKTINFHKMIKEAPLAEDGMNKDIDLAIDAAEHLAKNGASVNIATIAEVDNDRDVTVNSDTPKCKANNNWWYAIGQYRTWTKATVTKDGNNYTMKMSYNMRDFYDWKYDSGARGGLVTDGQMALLHRYGEAKQYEINGSVNIKINWTEGQRYNTGAKFKLGK